MIATLNCTAPTDGNPDSSVALAPLVPGSDTAHWLYDIWSCPDDGHWSDGDMPPDQIMPIVFEHLHFRSSFRICVVVNSGRGRIGALLGPRLAEFAAFGKRLNFDDVLDVGTVYHRQSAGPLVEITWTEMSRSRSLQTRRRTSFEDVPLDVILAGATW